MVTNEKPDSVASIWEDFVDIFYAPSEQAAPARRAR